MHTLFVEFESEIVGYLSASRDHDAVGSLEVYDVEHALEREFIEIETVADVVVGRDGLGVVVNHDRAVSLFPYRLESLDSAPVELHR